MIQGVGQGGGSLAKAAIEAALKSQGEAARAIRERAVSGLGTSEVARSGSSASADFAGALLDGIKAVDASVKDADRLPMEVASGNIEDFAELAGRLKQSEMTFKFALEVRNKLIDAYRETMRMSV